MAVHAHFFVQEITDNASNGTGVLLKASTRGPNDWSKYTPVGEFSMRVLNPDAADWFRARLGKDVSIVIDEIGDDTVRATEYQS